MSRSTLSIRISISQLVEGLNDGDDCIDVIRLLKNELDASIFRKIVNRIIFQLTQSLTNDSLIQIAKTINDTYSLQSTHNKISTVNNKTTNCKQNASFPLLRLPDDL